jgi:hypothetical protein
MKPRIYLGQPARINLVQAFGDVVGFPTLEKFRKRFRIQLTSGNAETAGGRFRQAEEIVGYRHGGFHTPSMTRVIPKDLRTGVD